MSQRRESPSSINTYYQCPRKYWYHYIKHLPSFDTIHTARGNAVHEALERFFKKPQEDYITYENCKKMLSLNAQEIFLQVWASPEYQAKLKPFNDYLKNFYFTDSLTMVTKWAERYADKVLTMRAIMPYAKAFNLFAPIYTEREYNSEKYNLTGKIDAVHKINGETIVRDYKTSKSDAIDDSHKMQASIYALLYLSTYKEAPHKVIFEFLKVGEVEIPIELEMLQKALWKIHDFHKLTETQDESQYPTKPNPFCKFSGGECDYYKICNPFGKCRKTETIEEYGKRASEQKALYATDKGTGARALSSYEQRK